MTVITETERALRAEVAALKADLGSARSELKKADVRWHQDKLAAESQVAALKAERDALKKEMRRAADFAEDAFSAYLVPIERRAAVLRDVAVLLRMAASAAPAALPAPTKEPTR